MSFLGITIGKKSTEKKRLYKLQKIEVRQAGKTERVELRQSAKVEKATVKAGADSIAYENGMTPQNDVTDITKVISQGIKAVASIYGGGSQSMDYDGISTGVEGQVGASAIAAGSMNVSGLGSSKMPLFIVGGILLFMMFKKK